MPAPEASCLQAPAETEGKGRRATSRDVVAFTRRSSRRYNRARTSIGGLLVDVYSNALAIACVLAIVGSFVLALRDEIARRDPAQGGLVDERWQMVPANALWMLLTYLALSGILMIARRLGPASVSPSEGVWWLPLPVDRRPMVLPGLGRLVGGLGLASTLAYLPFSLLTALDYSVVSHLIAAGTFGMAAIVAVGSAAVLQLRRGTTRWESAGCAVALIPIAVLPSLASTLWPLLLTGAVAVAILAFVLPRTGEVAGSELIRGGGVSGHVGASVFLLDVNELHRALAAPERASFSGRASTLYARAARSPIAALLRADMVAFLRLQPGLAGPLIWLGTCVALILADAGLPAVVLLLVITVAGCVTSAGMGTVARRTALIPELDLMLPLSRPAVMLSRTLMPAAAMSLWMVVLTGVLVLLGSAGPGLVLLGAVAGLGMGSGAVRAGTRPATDWTAPQAETPFGPVPRTQLASLFRGTDVTVLSMVPVLLALYIGNVYPWLILVQMVVSAGGLAAVMASQSAAQPGR